MGEYTPIQATASGCLQTGLLELQTVLDTQCKIDQNSKEPKNNMNTTNFANKGINGETRLCIAKITRENYTTTTSTTAVSVLHFPCTFFFEQKQIVATTQIPTATTTPATMPKMAPDDKLSWSGKSTAKNSCRSCNKNLHSIIKFLKNILPRKPW